ncbi:hypothetical protein [Pseudomonas sp. Tri1]|uniref:hypothetical protein n=1 Tax=Pseudomonas sp. Tri1 TaxID=2823875 RepID=UPI001B33F082|nr:hypothetical protein [Pseudomonas sp. Tri1]
MGAWLDSHTIGHHSLVIELAKHAQLSVDSANVDQRGVRLDHSPASETPGVLPFAFGNLQSHEVAGFSQYWMFGGIKSQNVFSTAAINDSGELSISADDDQVIFASPFRVAFAGGVGILLLGVRSVGEGLEALLLLGGCGDLGWLLSHRNIDATKRQGDGQGKVLGWVKVLNRHRMRALLKGVRTLKIPPLATMPANATPWARHHR